MSLLSAIRVALAALLVHKGRSVLTSLGIVIGIAAVIAMVSAGSGARALLDDRLDSVGKNLILIRPGARTQQGVIADFATLTGDDARAVRRRLGPALVGVSETQLTQRIASTPTASHVTTVCGGTPELLLVRRWDVSSGRFISEDDVKKHAAVCLVGRTVQKKLFPNLADPVGQSVRVDRLEMRIVGVLASKGRSPTGADQDDQVFVPLTTLQNKIVGEEQLTTIITAPRVESELERLRGEIVKVLREHRRDKPGSETFDVSTVAEMAGLAVVLTAAMQALIAVIASISLLVGGIGIMNIMLVSVTERTREIGLRMAVGATPAEILTQFLIEAIVLATAGGLLGIILGLSAALGLASLAGWPLVVPPGAIAVACGVSGAVGVFFGFYPAWKASRLDPITALRHE